MLPQALQNRPELVSRRLDVSSAQSYATSERDLWLPSISAVGAAGLAPVHEDLLGSRYAAAGFNVNIPLFNGRQFGALRAEANAQAGAGAGSSRPTERHRARSSQSVAGIQRGVPAAFRDTAALGPGHASSRPRAAALQARTEFHHRAKPGAVKYDASRNYASQRKVRLRNRDIGAELSNRREALMRGQQARRGVRGRRTR
jgi:Outer membrane efflux protein